MDIYGYIKQCCTHGIITRKQLFKNLGIKYDTFRKWEGENILQPKQIKVIKEVIDTGIAQPFPPFEYNCKYCGNLFFSKRAKVEVCPICKDEIKCGVKLEVKEEVKKKHHRKLSINDILRIGKEHGIVGEGGVVDYGRTVQAIERGEIKV